MHHLFRHRKPKKFTFHDTEAVYRLAGQETWLGRQVAEAIDIIQKTIDDYGYEHVALSFNGGKDCTVLVHLLAAVFTKHLSSQTPSLESRAAIPTLYIESESSFPEEVEFVKQCREWYNLELEGIPGPMKNALDKFMDSRAKTGNTVKVVLIGTRRNDPHGGKLTHFSPTDQDWPQFMRVLPIIDWSYADVWAFLRSTELTLGSEKALNINVLNGKTIVDPNDDLVGNGGSHTNEARQEPIREGQSHPSGLEWCVLYDRGYTSLGSTHNTIPNPHLKRMGKYQGLSAISDVQLDEKVTDVGQLLGEEYYPAWELQDEQWERSGR